MTENTELLDHLAGALAQMSVVLDTIRPDQVNAPTPCGAWDVQTLAAHVVHDVEQFTVTASGQEADWTTRPAALEGSWVGAFDERADELMTAWRRQGPSDMIAMQIAELAVHAWDLARATGQQPRLQPGIAEVGLAWMQAMLQPAFRGAEGDGKSFGPEVPIGADASAYDRLVAFSGRQP